MKSVDEALETVWVASLASLIGRQSQPLQAPATSASCQQRHS